MKIKKLTVEIENKIIELHSKGFSQREIAKKIGTISRMVVVNVYQKHNLKGLSKIKITEDKKSKIYQLLEQGFNSPEIGAQLNLNPSAINQFLQREGVEREKFLITHEIEVQIMYLRNTCGLGTRKISKILNCSRPQIRTYLKYRGILNTNPPKIKKIITEKECNLCNKVKTVDNFDKQPHPLANGEKTFYYVARCKECNNLRKYLSICIHEKLRDNNNNLNERQVSIFEYLPYTIEDLKNHLESLFEPWMNWGNRGNYRKDEWNDNDQNTWKWQLDHIIPHSTFTYFSMEDENFQKAWALSNLRPLNAKQNILDGTNKTRHHLNN